MGRVWNWRVLGVGEDEVMVGIWFVRCERRNIGLGCYVVVVYKR